MPKLALQLGLGYFPGFAEVLSDDTSLSTFTVDGNAVTDGGTLNLANSYVGTALGGLTIVATPTDPAATVGTKTITPDPLVEGDNQLDFDVTAEDGVTVQHYNVTLHVLTAGAAEVTEVSFVGATGAGFVTVGEGKSFLISSESQRYCVWGNTGTESQPAPSGATTYLEVALTAMMTAEDVATAFEGVLSGAGPWSVFRSAMDLTITDTVVGQRTDAVDVDSGAAVSVTTQGADPS